MKNLYMSNVSAHFALVEGTNQETGAEFQEAFREKAPTHGFLQDNLAPSHTNTSTLRQADASQDAPLPKLLRLSQCICPGCHLAVPGKLQLKWVAREPLPCSSTDRLTGVTNVGPKSWVVMLWAVTQHFRTNDLADGTCQNNTRIS